MAITSTYRSIVAAALLAFAGNAGATVRSVVMFARTGERTPIVEPGPARLTSTGAQQMFSLGESFRARWLENNSTGTNASFAPIHNLNTERADGQETVILVPDTQYLQASAMAFMQAFYPPHEPNSQQISDNSQTLSDNSIVDSPLNGYVYPSIHTASELDMNSVFVSGADNCINRDMSTTQYLEDPAYLATLNDTQALYGMMGITVLPTDIFPETVWSYYAAYLIYDYVRYQYVHNASVFNMFNDSGSQNDLQHLRWLADQHEWALNGDQTPSGAVMGDRIRTIAGQTFAGKALGFFQQNMLSLGESNKLNIVVGEYDVMLALFSLLSLPDLNSDFLGLPEYGSALVFELFDMAGNGDGDGPASDADAGNDTDTGADYPGQSDLWVRFYFRNGSDYGSGLVTDPTPQGADLQAYPVFGRGPSETSMTWADFEAGMSRIMLANAGAWCEACDASSIFCPAFEEGSSFLTSSGGTRSGSRTRNGGALSPQVAGVVGAVVTLGVCLLIAALAVLLCGFRVRKQQPSVWSRRKQSDLGGFKGSAKLASDQDLTFARNAAPMGKSGAAVHEEGVVPIGLGASRGHERVGSWELKEPTSPRSIGESLGKDVEAGLSGTGGDRRPSFEGGEFGKPVAARESF